MSNNTVEGQHFDASGEPLYTKEQVRNYLRNFAYAMIQREGQYLPLVQPCQDYIQENNLN